MKTKKPFTSVIIKDHAGEILFRKDFVYSDVGADYFDFMQAKTNADQFAGYFIAPDGSLVHPMYLHLVYDLPNTYGLYEIQRTAYINKNLSY